MRRAPDPVPFDYPPVVLYEEDVQALAAALTDKGKGLEITAAGWLLDSAVELNQLRGRTLDSLTIAVREPLMSVQVFDAGTLVFSLGSEEATRETLAKVHDILQLRRAKTPLNYGWILTTLVSVPAFMYYLKVNFSIARGALDYIFPVVFGLCALALTQVMSVGFRRHPKGRVVVGPRPVNIPFMRRNRDALVVGVLSAVVGAVVGGLILLALQSSCAGKTRVGVIRRSSETSADSALNAPVSPRGR